MIEECTTPGARKRHYSDDLRPIHGGRVGRTLCGQSARDQEYTRAMYWRGPGYAPEIATLPECGLCAKSKRKREAAR